MLPRTTAKDTLALGEIIPHCYCATDLPRRREPSGRSRTIGLLHFGDRLSGGVFTPCALFRLKTGSAY